MMNSTSLRGNLGPWTLHAFVVLLAACREPSVPLSVALTDRLAGVVVAYGLAHPESLLVRVADGMPPLAGRYDTSEGAVRFTPRFPLEGIQALTVTVGSQRWTLPLAQRPALSPSTRVIAIHPSSPVLPANQLRWYLEFSAPMREGHAREHVRLRDATGKAVNRAFLEVAEELWDPTRTRLTLLFDMGRVKQGIQSRADLGPVLVAGRGYSLEIDSGWVDARGVSLAGDTVHRFTVTAERQAALDPAQWRVESAVTGTRDPLRVDFGRPLDHALAERMILVTSVDGERVGGTVRLMDHDRGMEFVPSQAWGSGRYQLRVHPALEDVAGNRVGHAFDAPLDQGESAGVGNREVIVAID
jgi:hypothetical protein